MPLKSIEWCLTSNNISGKDLYLVALATRQLPIIDISDSETVRGWPARILSGTSRLEASLPRAWGYGLWSLYASTIGMSNAHDRVRLLSKFLHIDEKKIVLVDHHTAHASSALFSSSFRDDVAVITLDGGGDSLSGTVSAMEDGKLRRVSSARYYDSIGMFYLGCTQFLGMKPNEHEYKVMGLAPYAFPDDVRKVYDKMENLFRVRNLRISSSINARYSINWIRRHLQPDRFDWISGAVQKLTENLLVDLAESVLQELHVRRLALAGGVFMNVKANMIISMIPELRDLFVMPSCGDESLPIGAAQYVYYSSYLNSSNSAEIPPLADLYLGPDFDLHSENIRRLASGSNVEIADSSDVEGAVAELLAAGEIVARFGGRSEWGARALGNRSILARADHSNVVSILNKSIKMRDFWMPFAPVILDTFDKRYVSNPKGISAPYMIIAFPSTTDGKRDLIAAMHPADGTLRPQVVQEKWNEPYYSVISRFERLSGLGGMLNTSFNLHGEPIVCSPEDAMNTFLRSGLKYMAIGDTLLKKIDTVR
jgi:carbamoyltransferase